MSYYILRQDLDIPGQPSVLRCPDDLDPLELLDGKLVTPLPQPLRLWLSPDSGKFRGCIIGGLLTLFHQVFRDELTRLGIDNIQYFPVELQNPEGQIEYKYSLINVLGLIEAVNEKGSVIKPRAMGGRGELHSFKIDPARIRGQRLFRVVGAPTLIVIDETLYQSLLAFNGPGILMYRTEDHPGY